MCNAIAYAHSRGVLHRDIKPGNIMLGPYGETLVVDWGLAKTIGLEGRKDETTGEALLPPSGTRSAPTQDGDVMGTPSFMSPEQAQGRLDELSPASDVYSLGATLYTLLTGLTPFGDRDVRRVLERVCRGEFMPPRLMNRSVPRGLEA